MNKYDECLKSKTHWKEGILCGIHWTTLFRLDIIDGVGKRHCLQSTNVYITVLSLVYPNIVFVGIPSKWLVIRSIDIERDFHLFFSFDFLFEYLHFDFIRFFFLRVVQSWLQNLLSPYFFLLCWIGEKWFYLNHSEFVCFGSRIDRQ